MGSDEGAFSRAFGSILGTLAGLGCATSMGVGGVVGILVLGCALLTFTCCGTAMCAGAGDPNHAHAGR